jgi:ribonuclease I
VNPWQRHKARLAIAILVVGALGAWFSAREAGDSTEAGTVPMPARASAEKLTRAAPNAKTAFDFYLLALTVHPAFCADGHAQNPECRTGAQRPLVIHGLWPERLAPRTYPHDCPTKTLELDPALEQELTEWMPGMAANLHEHEWREHGGCSGLDDDAYFRGSIDLARVLDGALRAKLTTLAGGAATATELREMADLYQPGIGATFTLHCRTLNDAPPGQREQAFLVEVRQCVDNDGPGGAPGTLLDCASVQRRDQGCGASFRIADIWAGPDGGT